MSIYDNETKIYPDLNPSVPQESQTYQLKKLTEIEAFFLDEIEARGQEAKRKKRLNTIIGIVDTSLITSAVIAGGASIPAFASGADLSVGAVLGGLGVVYSLLTVATRKFSRNQTVKQGKHDAIMLLVQSKLDSIADIISQAMQDGDISLTELQKVLQEREKYHKLNADIKNQTKAKVKQIQKEQREVIPEQERKEGKEISLRQIANSSRTQGANAI